MRRCPLRPAPIETRVAAWGRQSRRRRAAVARGRRRAPISVAGHAESERWRRCDSRRRSSRTALRILRKYIPPHRAVMAFVGPFWPFPALETPVSSKSGQKLHLPKCAAGLQKHVTNRFRSSMFRQHKRADEDRNGASLEAPKRTRSKSREDASGALIGNIRRSCHSCRADRGCDMGKKRSDAQLADEARLRKVPCFFIFRTGFEAGDTVGPSGGWSAALSAGRLSARSTFSDDPG